MTHTLGKGAERRNHLRVDGAGDAVVELRIQLGKLVAGDVKLETFVLLF